MSVFFLSRPAQILWRICFWLYLVLVFYFTLTPLPPEPVVIPHIDKLYHLVSFALVSLLLAFAYQRLSVLVTILLSTAVGIGIELIQYFIPNRSFSVADIIADGIGAVLGAWLAYRMIKQAQAAASAALELEE